MFEETFSGKQKATGARVAGKDFLALAKRDYYAVFEDFVVRAGDDEFDSFKDFMKELCGAAWQLCEHVAKQSYKNGIAKGRSSRQRRKRTDD